MINDFTDRRPALSGVIIVALFTIIPGAFMLTADALFRGGVNTVKILFVYALVLQLILWLRVERFFLVMLPFVVMLVGFIVSEIIYTISMSSAAPGAGPGAAAYLFSSVIVTVFGAEAAGMVAALFVYILIAIFRKIREIIVYR